MYPGYRFVDAYPHQRNHMPPYMHGYYPSFEATPPGMKMDAYACRPPITYEAPPHGGSFPQPSPVGCHGSCNHSYMPGYTGFRPPYPHYMPPTPFHGYGGYPMYPDTYPMQYMPPPHYSMAEPRYEYDKPKDHHCCGCANHQCSRKEDRPVKIEEQEPDDEKGKSSTSLVPVDFHKDYPYPVMWIPPEYVKNGENRKPLEPEVKTQDENPRPSEQKPNPQGVWFPFDIKNLGGHVENGEDTKKTEREKTVDKNQFPFPIFWMPYKPAEEEGKEKTEAVRGSECAKTSPTLGNGSTVQSKSVEEGSGVDGSSTPVEDKVVKVKIIPVKQLKEHQEKKMKEIGNSAKSTKQSEKKASVHGTKRESSPPSTSKLPPVCLRVEPLKRRSRSVGSRSPSPPGDKRESSRGREMDKLDMRPSISTMEKSQEVKQNEGNGQVLEEKKSVGAIKPDDAATKAGEVSPKETKGQTFTQEVSNAATTDAAQENCETVKAKNMSEEEAALIIQAAFRGFEVRKWEPLKKLKQIVMVKEQMIEVKHLIEAFELSPDVNIDNKQKLMIGETIMSLLLKLDAIQGLHPMVREIRKSVAKELVSLQEKLDSLAMEKRDAPIATPVVGISVDDKDSTPIQEGEAEVARKNIEDGKNSFQADPVLGEELNSSPNVEEEKECSEDETLASSLGQDEKLQSVHEEDGAKSEVNQNVEHVVPSAPTNVHQELATEESQNHEKIGTCESKVVQGEENLSPQADEATLITAEAAEDMSKPESGGVTMNANELFDLPSTEEHNVKISGGASDTGEAIGVTETQDPQSHTEHTPELLEENITMDAPKLGTPQTDQCLLGPALEEDGTHELALEVPQAAVTVEENGTMEAPKSEVPQEEDASHLEEPNGKDESFQDKEVVIEESEIEGDVITGAENVQSAEGKVHASVSHEQPSKEDEIEKSHKLEAAEENVMEDKQSDQKLLEENQRLKKMMEELIEAGKDQLSAITDLSGKVKYLERRLARKKKVKTRRAKSAKERIEDIVV